MTKIEVQRVGDAPTSTKLTAPITNFLSPSFARSSNTSFIPPTNAY